MVDWWLIWCFVAKNQPINDASWLIPDTMVSQPWTLVLATEVEHELNNPRLLSHDFPHDPISLGHCKPWHPWRAAIGWDSATGSPLNCGDGVASVLWFRARINENWRIRTGFLTRILEIVIMVHKALTYLVMAQWLQSGQAKIAAVRKVSIDQENMANPARAKTLSVRNHLPGKKNILSSTAWKSNAIIDNSPENLLSWIIAWTKCCHRQ